MIRILAVTVLLSLAATPSFACNWTQTSSVETQSTTASAQPAAPACPTCVVPDHAGGATQVAPTPQKPS